MLGSQELKESIKITSDNVECPVQGCTQIVPRQRVSFKADDRYKCLRHRIYISPSTFQYEDWTENLLWKEKRDLELLHLVLQSKRESRMARDNSEDAVTWNVFRFLERNSLLESWLKDTTEKDCKDLEVIYWSYSQKEEGVWSLLKTARKEFGEEAKRSSEPDVIIKTGNAIFFIEAKLTSGNVTTPTDANNPKKYQTGGDKWFSKVFRTSYETIAITEKRYELMRFWLLGTWIARQLGLDFYLISLTLAEKQMDIEECFKKHIKDDLGRKLLGTTWENIYRFTSSEGISNDKETMLRFFENKTLGYRKGVLQKAFLIE